MIVKMDWEVVCVRDARLGLSSSLSLGSGLNGDKSVRGLQVNETVATR